MPVLIWDAIWWLGGLATRQAGTLAAKWGIGGLVAAVQPGFWLRLVGYLLPAALVAVWLSLGHAKALGEVQGKAEAACAVRIANIAAEINTKAEEQIAAARAAAAAVVEARTPAEIKAACKADKNCREHRKE